jgi:arylsulfatase A-like enzyme
MPHLPLAASEKFAGRTAHGLYGDAIEEIDWSVGEVMAALEKAGAGGDTMVIFTSDNGPVRWQGRVRHNSLGGSAGPLRGRKNTTWEGGMREPCLMRWPGRIPQGAVCGELASTMDLMPTLARLAGTAAPRDRIIDGKDIWPLISGQPGAKSPHEVFYYYRDERLQALRDRRWKIHMYPEEWEPAERERTKGPLLFDLENDIGETTDAAARHPDAVRRLEALAEKAREDLGDAMQNRTGKNVRPVGRIRKG